MSTETIIIILLVIFFWYINQNADKANSIEGYSNMYKSNLNGDQYGYDDMYYQWAPFSSRPYNSCALNKYPHNYMPKPYPQPLGYLPICNN